MAIKKDFSDIVSALSFTSSEAELRQGIANFKAALRHRFAASRPMTSRPTPAKRTGNAKPNRSLSEIGGSTGGYPGPNPIPPTQ